jgi:hypothetical protein
MTLTILAKHTSPEVFQQRSSRYRIPLAKRLDITAAQKPGCMANKYDLDDTRKTYFT